jgi:hypothetical protein
MKHRERRIFGHVSGEEGECVEAPPVASLKTGSLTHRRLGTEGSFPYAGGFGVDAVIANASVRQFMHETRRLVSSHHARVRCDSALASAGVDSGDVFRPRLRAVADQQDGRPIEEILFSQQKRHRRNKTWIQFVRFARMVLSDC